MSPFTRPAIATAIVATLTSSHLPVLAQAADPMLKPGQVTESALVDALAIDSQDAMGQTRSIRPTMKSGAPAAPGRASLLITFATNSADLTPESVRALTTVAKALQSDRLAGFAFRVEGHADPRGGADLNQRLSEQRAQSVVSYLVDKMGIQPERLAAIGKGASEPIDTQHPEAAENRRVTIVTTR
jgi:outer membrane protein OmpA-like peptidoglycan-associated protein